MKTTNRASAESSPVPSNPTESSQIKPNQGESSQIKPRNAAEWPPKSTCFSAEGAEVLAEGRRVNHEWTNTNYY